jgi:hypothetical protein
MVWVFFIYNIYKASVSPGSVQQIMPGLPEAPDIITNFMELSPSSESATCAATQELPSNAWNPKVYYRVHNCPPLIPILSQTNLVHTTHESFQVRSPLWHFITSLFLRWGVVSPAPNHKLKQHSFLAERPPIFGCPRLLIQYIGSYPPCLEAVSSIRNLRTRHAMVKWEPPNKVKVLEPERQVPAIEIVWWGSSAKSFFVYDVGLQWPRKWNCRFQKRRKKIVEQMNDCLL